MQMYLFQQGGSLCLSSFKIIHLENDLCLSTDQSYSIPKLHYIKKNSDVNDLVVASYQLSRRARTQGTLPSPAPHCRLGALIQSEHNHHGSDAALLLFGISYTCDAEPHAEMEQQRKVLDSP